MPGSAGPNLGLITGYAAHETGWGTGAFNPNFDMLDGVVFLTVINTTTTTPPGSPASGDRYIVGVGATGAWSGKDKQLAIYRGGAWVFYTPKAGWRAYNTGISGYIRYDGTSWNVESAGGLFGQIMSTTPTQASTGLTSNAGTGNTVTDGATGVNFVTTGGGIIYGTAPATPYTITALVTPGAKAGVAALGWYDGTKIHFIYGGCQTVGSGNVTVQKNSAVNTFFATDYNTLWNVHERVWLQISDDGTNVFFRASNDGVLFDVAFNVAKASGYLGATGYTNLMFGTPGAAGSSTILSWKQT